MNCTLAYALALVYRFMNEPNIERSTESQRVLTRLSGVFFFERYLSVYFFVKGVLGYRKSEKEGGGGNSRLPTCVLFLARFFLPFVWRESCAKCVGRGEETLQAARLQGK